MIRVTIESDNLSELESIDKVAKTLNQAILDEDGTVVKVHSNVKKPKKHNLFGIKTCVVAKLPQTLAEEETLLLLERVRSRKIGPTILGTLQLINKALGTTSFRFKKKVEEQ